MRRSTPKENALVLLSGGLDSAVVAATLVNSRTPTTALFVNYGQPAVNHEMTAARNIAKHLSIHLDCLTIPDIPRITTETPDDPNAWLFPARNLHLIAHATDLAIQKTYTLIGLGCALPDANQYLDASTDFLDTQSQAISLMTNGQTILYTPLAFSSKLEVLALAHLNGLPLSVTRSCLSEQEQPCNSCPACRLRNNAVSQARAMNINLPITP